MPKPIVWLLQGTTFIMFWLFVDRTIKMQNITEAYNGFSNDYKENYKTYDLAKDAYDDVKARYARIQSKLMFTAQLQGLILMSLALHSVTNPCEASSYNLYFSIALFFDFLGIMLTLHALNVKTLLVLDYSVFQGTKKFSDKENNEFNLVISKLHDRCDFLADMYKIIITFFVFSFISTIFDLLPIHFLKQDEGVIICSLIGIWSICKIIRVTLADAKDRLENGEIEE